MSFKFITKQDKLEQLYIQIPKALMYELKYKKLSSNAKLLYGMLLDRTSLSIENNWFDKHDRAYIICEIDEIEIFLGCARATAAKTLKELEKVNLVMKFRRGQGEANLLYIAHVDATKETLDVHLNYHKRMLKSLKSKREMERKEREEKQKFKNCTSIENTSVQKTESSQSLESLRSSKNELLEVQILNGNNTDSIYCMYVCTDESDTNKISKDLFNKLEIKASNKNDKLAWLESTIKKLIEKKIFTLEEYELSVKEYSDKTYKKSSKTKESSETAPKVKTRFHNVTPTYAKYGEELVDVLQDNQSTKFKNPLESLYKNAINGSWGDLTSVSKNNILNYAKENNLFIPREWNIENIE